MPLLITFIYLIPYVLKTCNCRLAKVNVRKTNLITYKIMTQLMCRFFHLKRNKP